MTASIWTKAGAAPVPSIGLLTAKNPLKNRKGIYKCPVLLKTRIIYHCSFFVCVSILFILIKILFYLIQACFQLYINNVGNLSAACGKEYVVCSVFEYYCCDMSYK
jgi:hypothetical protein